MPQPGATARLPETLIKKELAERIGIDSKNFPKVSRVAADDLRAAKAGWIRRVPRIGGGQVVVACRGQAATVLPAKGGLG